MAVAALARLTVKEASRRRLLLALVLLTLVVIAGTTWGFSRLATMRQPDGTPIPPLELKLAVSQLVIVLMFMFSFVLALSAVFVAATSVAGDIDSGVVLAILPRPMRRLELVVGKWLGLFLLITVYAVVACALEFTAVRLTTGYSVPHPLEAVAYLIAEGTALMTLALMLSTRMSTITAGVISVVVFGMAWIGGIAASIGAAFNNAAIVQVGTLSSLLLPTDGLWRGSIFYLEPAVVLAGASNFAAGNPFFAAAPPPLPYLLWALAWAAGVLALGAWSFSRRDL
jgi:ABC-type transport system involved in multi-copper enzyme maturation permease subunit